MRRETPLRGAICAAARRFWCACGALARSARIPTNTEKLPTFPHHSGRLSIINQRSHTKGSVRSHHSCMQWSGLPLQCRHPLALSHRRRPPASRHRLTPLLPMRRRCAPAGVRGRCRNALHASLIDLATANDGDGCTQEGRVLRNTGWSSHVVAMRCVRTTCVGQSGVAGGERPRCEATVVSQLSCDRILAV